MEKALRVLLVEDDERDAELLLLELERGNFSVQSERVDTPEAMSAALARQPWDVVISDYFLPRFSAPSALELLKERQLDLPFIIVSGVVGDEAVVAALRAGAHDFVPKSKLGRLVPAIQRELLDAALRTERTQMEEQLLISERMASVGTLAAGVAHEINNPLAALMANLQFATEDVAQLVEDVLANGAAGDRPEIDARVREWLATQLRRIEEPLRDARESADRVRSIVKDLKIFSRSNEEKSGPVDVRRVLESSLRMAWNEIRHRARLIERYEDVAAVEGNEGRLGQVFLNLIVNAAQSIPEGRADQNEIRVTTRENTEGRVVVEIQDTGVGIPEAVLAKIFDPFFTTKPVGQGTGLGLAICSRIVAGLGGQIVVESQVGIGTLIRTILPVATTVAAPAVLAPAPVTPGRRCRILVVDDDPMLRAAIERMLSAEHEVLGLASARTAIERVCRGERFDLILCDLMMPDVTGADLHAELLQRAPEQAEKIVFMTGGAFTSGARAFLDRVANSRLEKPFDADDLLALVRGLLR
ncbi:MAG: response regulator [Deltaproteobacteria bacterium]